MQNTKIHLSVWFIVLLSLVVITSSGCERPGEPDPPPDPQSKTTPEPQPTATPEPQPTATPEPQPTATPIPFPKFSITSPSNNEQLTKCWHVWMTGEGMRQDHISVDIRIYTNKWWQQRRKFEYLGGASGQWRKLVDFGGTGSYNDHTIDVIVKYADGSEDHDRVTDIVCASR